MACSPPEKSPPEMAPANTSMPPAVAGSTIMVRAVEEDDREE